MNHAKRVEGFTLLELLAAIAIIAFVALMWWLSSEEKDTVIRTSCLQQQTGVLQFETVWKASTTPNDPIGDPILCKQYKAAAEAWNNQCSDYFAPFVLPADCVGS